jgi:hypothetical protein
MKIYRPTFKDGITLAQGECPALKKQMSCMYGKDGKSNDLLLAIATDTAAGVLSGADAAECTKYLRLMKISICKSMLKYKCIPEEVTVHTLA